MKRVLDILLALERFLLWAVLLQMVLLTFVQVVLRYGFHSALPWAEELLRFEVVFITFMCVGLCVKRNAHIGVDFLYQISPPKGKKALAIAANTLTAALCFFICYFAAETILRLSGTGFVTPALGIPKYVPYIPMAVGCLIMAVRSAVQVWMLALGVLPGPQEAD
jgi:C4-dicarboxylate transporter DctQ subunit